MKSPVWNLPNSSEQRPTGRKTCLMLNAGATSQSWWGEERSPLMGICETAIMFSGNVRDALNVLLECSMAQKPRHGNWSAGGTWARSSSQDWKSVRLIGIIATVNPPNELRLVVSLSRQLLISHCGMSCGRKRPVHCIREKVLDA